MKYRYLGSTGLKVAQICLGTMTFGREVDASTSQTILDYYLDCGGNFVDTADAYGPQGRAGASESVLGQWLKRKRDEVIVSTKVGFPTSTGLNDLGLSRAHIVKELERSLQRLKTDYVDLYHVHCWDLATPLEETLSVLDGLVRSGKVRYLGVSNYMAWQLMKALGMCDRYRLERFVSAQMQYSLVVRDIEREIIPLCESEGLSILAWGPLGGGFLSGKYRKGEKPSGDSRLVEVKENEEEAWSRRATERNFQIAATVGKIAKSRDISHSQVALAWLLDRNVIPIIGARNLEQLKVNLASAEVSLNSEEKENLDRVSWIDKGYPFRFIHEVYPNRRTI